MASGLTIISRISSAHVALKIDFLNLNKMFPFPGSYNELWTVGIRNITRWIIEKIFQQKFWGWLSLPASEYSYEVHDMMKLLRSVVFFFCMCSILYAKHFYPTPLPLLLHYPSTFILQTVSILIRSEPNIRQDGWYFGVMDWDVYCRVYEMGNCRFKFFCFWSKLG